MPDNGSRQRSQPVKGILHGGYSEGMIGMTGNVKPHRNSRVLPERPTGNKETEKTGEKAEVLYRGTRRLRSPPVKLDKSDYKRVSRLSVMMKPGIEMGIRLAGQVRAIKVCCRRGIGNDGTHGNMEYHLTPYRQCAECRSVQI